ncbi:ABC transporter substrate-binding protein [Aureimonas ureilytica]|uniref:ABC transporter substrate-binding protein n=1 Tax=Aureimonas ureilytica TaxID=401562 RepID=UPI003CF4A547
MIRLALLRPALAGLALLSASSLTAFAQTPPPAATAPAAGNVPAGGSVPAGVRVWPSEPRLKPDGTKWRIGYYEGGQYKDYEVILKATVRGLMAIGWIKPMDLPVGNNPEPGGFWRWLSAHAVSDYVEFPADAYYAAGNFDKEKRPEVRTTLLDRLKSRHDLDLMLALGTWAGQDLSADDISTPVVVASTSDPIGSKIIASETDSGHDHLTAKVEPQRYARQVELFDDIFHFKKLGLVYENSPEGRTFAAVDDIERIARERGFEIVPCFAPFNNIPQAEAEAKVEACYNEISGKSDAVYITVHRGLTETSFPKAVAPLIAHDLPTFSMAGESEVRLGALMSVAQSDFVYVGRFHAETIARIFNGAKPRDLPQVWQAPAKIALNLHTAEEIGYDPSVDILLASDEIFGVDLMQRTQ